MQRGWPKSCSCGETWTREQWNELPAVGLYRAEELLELRTCVCGANLAISAAELGDTPGPASPHDEA